MKRRNRVSRSLNPRIRSAMLLPAAILILSLALAYTAWAAAEPQYGGTYRIHSTPIRSLDPHMETASQTTMVTVNTNNGLLCFSPDMTGVEPDLAESWRQIDDLTYEFKLHKGVRFHDVPPVNGRELTAADVKYSIERIAGMHGRASDFKHSYYFEGKIDSIETPDDHTVIIKTKKPYAAFLKYIASPWSAIVAKEVVEQFGDLKRHAIGTGPFILKEYVMGSHVTLVKNPDYFKAGKPYLDGIHIRIMTDPSSVVSAFIAGRLDGAQVTYHFMPTIKKQVPDTIVEQLEGTYMWTLRCPPWIEGVKPLQPPFDKPEVRQAIAMAIDKQRLLELAWGGFGKTQVGPVPSAAIYSLSQEDQVPYDPEKAKALLAQAGYPDGFSAELMTWNLSYMTQPAQILQQMLKEVGIEIKLNLLEFAQYFNRAYRFDYEMALHLMTAGVDPEEWLIPYYGKVEEATYYKWSNPELWDMIDRQQHIMDPAQRETLIKEIQRKVIADAPNLFLYTQDRFLIRKPNVHLKRYLLDVQGLMGEYIWMAQQ
ncbi:ABC transporter substrate-binding protein [Desulfatitalea alkaliphila]|uniref:ABC transporter substrate-binding protein n=1 Tax=Desulfatitalea alkaliphila TaxID=2929485 RepID=A0AA41R379_9BACT|nr:ABC transporter substrate-binding protein [Desulfatitalea alkaliphila]MCJ8500245.1 ABC transporter substrate-binding protein [Desulfatitalea alkaliphila]